MDNPKLIEITFLGEKFEFKLTEADNSGFLNNTWYYGTPNYGIGLYFFEYKWCSNAVWGDQVIQNESLDRAKAIELGVNSYVELRNAYR